MANLRDFGLVTPTGGSNLGEPGQALGGETELERTMRETPNYGHTLRNFLSSPSGILGTLGGALASAAAGGGGTGGAGEGLTGFLSGLQGGVQNQYQDEVSAYKARVDAAKAAADAQDKSRERLVQIATSQPGLLQNMGVTPEQFGELVAPGMGVSVDPATMYKKKTQSAANTDLGDALFKVLPFVKDDPEASKKVAVMINNTMGLNMPPDVLQQFYEQQGQLTDAQIVDTFGLTGAAEIVNREKAYQNGDMSYKFNWGNLKYTDKSKLPSEKAQSITNDLFAKVNAAYKEAMDAGHPVDVETAKRLALTEPEAKLLENNVHSFAPALSVDEAFRAYLQSASTVQTLMLMKGGVFSNPEKVISNAVHEGMNAANTLSQQATDKVNVNVYMHFLEVAKAEHPEWTYEQQKAEAKKQAAARGAR